MPSLHHASALRSPQSGPAAAQHAPADPFTSANPPGGFASLLRQVAPAAPAAPGPAPTAQSTASPPAAQTQPRQTASVSTQARQCEATHPSAAEPGPTEATDAAPANPARALFSARLRAAAAAGGAARGALAHPGAADVAEATERASSASAPSDTPDASTASARDSSRIDPTPLPAPGTAPTAPTILQWLADLQRATGPSVRTSDANDTRLADAAGGNPEAANSTPAPSAAAAHARNQHATDLKASAEAKDSSAPGPAALGAATDPRRFAALLGEHNAAEKPQLAPTPAATSHAIAAAAAAAAALAPARPAGFGPAAPVAVTIAAPVTAPEFAQVLGLQMSVLARDGIQRAELHLNPAEMGPVSVQIVMDGTQARVDFGADLAATRQAIEAGLPELASALRDAGFTLAGGGVSQHSGGRSHANEAGDGGSSARRHRPDASLPDDAASRVSAAARRIVSAGGIDVFA